MKQLKEDLLLNKLSSNSGLLAYILLAILSQEISFFFRIYFIFWTLDCLVDKPAQTSLCSAEQRIRYNSIVQMSNFLI